MTPVRFRGDLDEYFRIWVVNALLSIVTLGIFSAWAKVRNKKYFLGNTTIAGHAFDYHATGLQILIRRLVFIAVLVAVVSIWRSSSNGPVVALILCLVAFPWLINHALSFNAAMTSWCNARFRFEGQYFRAMLVFVVYPLLSVATLGIAFPFAARAIARYVIGQHSIRGCRFSFDSPIRPFYFALRQSAVWALISIGFAFPLFVLASIGLPPVVALALLPHLIGCFRMIVTAYLAGTRNSIVGAMELEHGIRFRSTISPKELVRYVRLGTPGVIWTAGLYLPRVRIALADYLCAHTWVDLKGHFRTSANAAIRQHGHGPQNPGPWGIFH